MVGRQFNYRFRWLEGVLLPTSYLLLLGGGVLAVRPALAGSGSVTDYLPGVVGLVAGLFGLALCELLGAVHELHTRLARQEFNRSGNLPREAGPGAERPTNQAEPGAAADGGA